MYLREGMARNDFSVSLLHLNLSDSKTTSPTCHQNSILHILTQITWTVNITLFIYLFIGGSISLCCCSDWPKTHCIHKVGLGFTEIPLPLSPSTHPFIKYKYFKKFNLTLARTKCTPKTSFSDFPIHLGITQICLLTNYANKAKPLAAEPDHMNPIPRTTK